MYDINKFLLDLVNSLNESKYSWASALIKSYHPLDIQDEKGRSALMIAIAHNKNDIIDLILESNSCDNKSLSISDKYGDNALSLVIRLERDPIILKKILKRLKYNLYKEIQEEIMKCHTEITNLELEQLSIDFNLEAAMGGLSFINPIDILKTKKIKLEEDLVKLNNGISWIDDNMNTLGINHAIKIARDKNNLELVNLLSVPPPEHVVIQINRIKRILKKPSSRKIRTPEDRRKHEEEEKRRKTIEKRSQEQKLRREKLLSGRRMGNSSDSEDSEIDGRIGRIGKIGKISKKTVKSIKRSKKSSKKTRKPRKSIKKIIKKSNTKKKLKII